jgi:hypothetical protein
MIFSKGSCSGFATERRFPVNIEDRRVVDLWHLYVGMVYSDASIEGHSVARADRMQKYQRCVG